jgi:hypothetical protein
LAQIEGYLGRRSAAKSQFQGLGTDPRHIIEDFEHAAREQASLLTFHIQTVLFQCFFAANLYAQKQKTENSDQAWNSCSVELCRATRLHVKTYLIRNYFQYISGFKGSPETRQILEDLGKLYALDQLTNSQTLFLKVLFEQFLMLNFVFRTTTTHTHRPSKSAWAFLSCWHD